jgi:hypothetical protein
VGFVGVSLALGRGPQPRGSLPHHELHTVAHFRREDIAYLYSCQILFPSFVIAISSLPILILHLLLSSFRLTLGGILQAPVIRVHKNVVNEVDIPLDATPASTPRVEDAMDENV